MAFGEIAEKQEPGLAFDDGRDRRTVERAHDEIALPVARDAAVGGLWRPLGDGDDVAEHVGPLGLLTAPAWTAT